MSDTDFNSTLEAARTGEAWAWEAIYRSLAPRVLSYVRARGAREPEDLLGEIFLSVVRDLARFTGEENDFRAWIFTIAHHRLVDDARARSRRVTTTELDELSAASLAGGDVETEALDSLSTGEIERLIASLTEDQQAVLLMRILGGLSLQQCAEALEKPVGAVKALQHRAIGAIRRAMSGSNPYPLAAVERLDG